MTTPEIIFTVIFTVGLLFALSEIGKLSRTIYVILRWQNEACDVIDKLEYLVAELEKKAGKGDV
jgi:hypothetical protein